MPPIKTFKFKHSTGAVIELQTYNDINHVKKRLSTLVDNANEWVLV